jgi:hypothetical protein
VIWSYIHICALATVSNGPRHILCGVRWIGTCENDRHTEDIWNCGSDDVFDLSLPLPHLIAFGMLRIRRLKYLLPKRVSIRIAYVPGSLLLEMTGEDARWSSLISQSDQDGRLLYRCFFEA